MIYFFFSLLVFSCKENFFCNEYFSIDFPAISSGFVYFFFWFIYFSIKRSFLQYKVSKCFCPLKFHFYKLYSFKKYEFSRKSSMQSSIDCLEKKIDRWRLKRLSKIERKAICLKIVNASGSNWECTTWHVRLGISSLDLKVHRYSRRPPEKCLFDCFETAIFFEDETRDCLLTRFRFESRIGHDEKKKGATMRDKANDSFQ